MLRRKLLQHRLFRRSGGGFNPFVKRIAELACQFSINLARIALQLCCDLRREQCGHDSIFVGRPNRAVAPEERSSGTLFPDETQRAIQQAADEPLEPDWNFIESSFQLRGHAIDHAAAHDCLSHADMTAPLRPVREEVLYTN